MQRSGNIGYGIRPSARRQGHAGAALRAMLEEARGLGLHEVLLICEETNTASARTIERADGILAGRIPADGGSGTNSGSGTDDVVWLRKYVIPTAPGTGS